MLAKDSSPRILIVRLSHIGDCLLTIPLAVALRKAFPRATIGWAVEPPSDQLLACVPGIDRVLPLPRKWSRSAGGFGAARRIVREFDADVAIDPQSLSKSAAVAWFSGAKMRIGFDRPEGREIAPWLATHRIRATREHLVDRTLEMPAPLDVPSATPTWNLTLPEDACRTAERIVADASSGEPCVVVNPGGTWPSKRWLPERFAAVARFLGRERGRRSLVVWAGEQELAWATTIVERSGGFATLAPKTSLLELAAILAKSAFYLGGDSGPMHLAQAVGARCLALFGPTLPQKSGPYGAGHVVLQKYYQEGSCRRRRREPNFALQEISIDDVCAACDTVLRPDSQGDRRAAA